ncbi:tRNA (N6-threonylcarbamoyladenosine(37)-N6)-methyltransferase TrmO [Aliidiomarina celeris]|uniref:tRNA (N6-threonylcarbamoyladenosine(37)-N6)-methyltransferase TrmO n=1 Tax=Aliidiomarina celeris TaxID=2249428 RepID=UPI000DE94271|nr:tRNA (N6-threonylcarbamoyladenosine(37)-N6)-methyltransferase TrmO [Aliidiomarina celeris]
MHSIIPIGYIESPYRQKFAIPRQPGLVKSARGAIRLENEFAHPDCTRGLEEFSHLWVQFIFHETQAHGWKPLVRPPRLGGNAKRGVFATRSTFRPNAIGLSVVEIIGIRHEKRKTWIDICGLDLLDQTPVIDIKPYLPYSDAHISANAGFADQSPHADIAVQFTAAAEQFIASQRQYPELKQLIVDVLAQDPRPAYHRTANAPSAANRVYGIHLYEFNIKWIFNDRGIEVLALD